METQKSEDFKPMNESLHVRTAWGSVLGADESVRARCRDAQTDFCSRLS